jgi:hypothetical protein
MWSGVRRLADTNPVIMGSWVSLSLIIELLYI